MYHMGLGQTDDTVVPVTVTASGLPGGYTDADSTALLPLTGIDTSVQNLANDLVAATGSGSGFSLGSLGTWFTNNSGLLAGLAAFATLVLLMGGKKR